jgi:hypothetical protein
VHVARIQVSLTLYHLVILDTQRRRLTVRPFSLDALTEATEQYAEAESEPRGGEAIDPVLVAGGNIDQLRKTYPNYFLDSTRFIEDVDSLMRTKIRR